MIKCLSILNFLVLTSYFLLLPSLLSFFNLPLEGGSCKHVAEDLCYFSCPHVGRSTGYALENVIVVYGEVQASLFQMYALIFDAVSTYYSVPIYYVSIFYIPEKSL